MEGIIRAEIKEGRKAQDDPYDSEDSEDLWDFDDDYVKVCQTSQVENIINSHEDQHRENPTTLGLEERTGTPGHHHQRLYPWSDLRRKIPRCHQVLQIQIHLVLY